MGTEGDWAFQAALLQGESAEPGLDLAHSVPSLVTPIFPEILG